MTPAPLTGTRAEQIAEAYLRQHGLNSIARNYRCACGEIDLVMRDGEVLVFVEIRYRTSARFGSALESIDRRKRHRIVLAARHYLSRRNRPEPRCRFDVLALSGAPPGNLRYDWIRDAFLADS
ncbi:MAG: YraN family protein [Gammaproteobacteria bacterium]|nr:YraN family protein [Gammaproteobacteria bacterium]